MIEWIFWGFERAELLLVTCATAAVIFESFFVCIVAFNRWDAMPVKSAFCMTAAILVAMGFCRLLRLYYSYDGVVQILISAVCMVIIVVLLAWRQTLPHR